MARAGKRTSRKKSPSDEPASETGEAAETPGIDLLLDRLEAVVSELEQGDLPLERALAKFEEGVRLARTGGQLLGALEERVEKLLEDRDEAVPFGGDEDDDE